jgi:hypothetical protein
MIEIRAARSKTIASHYVHRIVESHDEYTSWSDQKIADHYGET